MTSETIYIFVWSHFLGLNVQYFYVQSANIVCMYNISSLCINNFWVYYANIEDIASQSKTNRIPNLIPCTHGFFSVKERCKTLRKVMKYKLFFLLLQCIASFSLDNGVSPVKNVMVKRKWKKKKICFNSRFLCIKIQSSSKGTTVIKISP